MTNELSPAELAQRLESLESRLAYQEHWLDTLDQAVAQQERLALMVEAKASSRAMDLSRIVALAPS